MKRKGTKIEDGLRQNRGTGSSVSLFSIGILLMFLLPWMVYQKGAGVGWIAIGSFAGVLMVWQVASYRLMRFSLQHEDRVTIPGFLDKRFMEKQPVLRIFFAVPILAALILGGAMLMYGIGEFAEQLFGISKLYSTIGAFCISAGLFLLFGRTGLRLAERWISVLVLASLVLLDFSIIRVLGTRRILENIFHSWAAGSVTEYVNVGYMEGRALSVAEILTLFSFGLLILGNPLVLQRFQFADRARTIHKSRRWGVIFSILSLFLATLTGGLLRASLYPARISNIKTLFKTILTEDKGRGFLFQMTGLMFVVTAAILVVQLLHSCILSASEIIHDDLMPARYKRERKLGRNRRSMIMVVMLVETIVAAFALCSGSWIYGISLDVYMILACGLAPVMYFALRSQKTTAKGCIVGFLVGAMFLGVWEFSGFVPQGYGFVTLHELTGLGGILPAQLAGFLFTILGTMASKEPSREVVAAFEEVQYRLVSSKDRKKMAEKKNRR